MAPAACASFFIVASGDGGSAANAHIMPDRNDDNLVELTERHNGAVLPRYNTWILARRPEPYKLVLQNECPADTILQFGMGTYPYKYTPLRSFVWTTNEVGAQVWIFPKPDGYANYADTPPFCVKNEKTEIWFDASGTNSVSYLYYTIRDARTSSRPIILSRTLQVNVYDLNMPPMWLRKGTNYAWQFPNTGTVNWQVFKPDGTLYLTRTGTSLPVSSYPIGTYTVTATFQSILNDDAPVVRTSQLHIVDMKHDHDFAGIKPDSTREGRVPLSLKCQNLTPTDIAWTIAPQWLDGALLHNVPIIKTHLNKTASLADMLKAS
jgi:hypothetical protein